MPRLTPSRPRNVTATRGQVNAIIGEAKPALRAMLLLCSDLAIRSGTAVKIGSANYNRETGNISFVTKKDARVTLAVTDEVRAMFETCDMNNPEPFVTQLRNRQTGKRGRPSHGIVDRGTLRKELTAIRAQLGIQTRIVPHDLRRTSAVALLRQTQDIRLVQSLLGHRSLQSTIWYLDHDLNPVSKLDLEAIKKPFIAWRKGRTA